MEYMRVFSSPTITKWFDKSPKLSQLLKCFDAQRNLDTKKSVTPVSVFHARNQKEELQNVAAIFQNNVRTVAKQFAICIRKSDCSEAGIEIDTTHGKTGIACVDARHADFKGTLENLIELARVLTQKICEGENRVRIFSQHAILGEIAVFSRTSNGIDEFAKKRCNQVLKKTTDLFKFPNDARNVVEILVKMDDKQDMTVTALRKLVKNIGHDSLIERLRYWLIDKLLSR